MILVDLNSMKLHSTVGSGRRRGCLVLRSTVYRSKVHSEFRCYSKYSADFSCIGERCFQIDLVAVDWMSSETSKESVRGRSTIRYLSTKSQATMEDSLFTFDPVKERKNALIAIPKKGRLYERCMKLLEGAGLDHHRPNRLDVAHCTNLPITIVFLPASDIASCKSSQMVWQLDRITSDILDKFYLTFQMSARETLMSVLLEMMSSRSLMSMSITLWYESHSNDQCLF